MDKEDEEDWWKEKRGKEQYLTLLEFNPIVLRLNSKPYVGTFER
jgi:hypothetical protein